jgi:O-antigen/teichoic acid export membrane protein
MRLSTQLISNAVTSYAALGTQFVLGIFFVWYLNRSIGLEGYGLIVMAAGTFGISGAMQLAIGQSLGRELAASIATDDQERVERTFNSAMAFGVLGAVVTFLAISVLALLAYLRVLRTPDDYPELAGALAVLFLGEASITAVQFLTAPYGRSIFGARRIATSNLLQVLSRVAHVASAPLAIGWLFASSPLHVKLYGFAATLFALRAALALVRLIIARRIVKGLRIRPRSFDRAEFRAIALTVWHTSQFALLMEFNPLFLQLLINLFFGVAYNGMWGIVVAIGGHAMLVGEGVLRGISPIATHMGVRHTPAAIRNLMARTIRYQLAAALPWCATYLVFMVPILNIWIRGGLELNTDLAAESISADAAINLIALMASIQIAAMLCRVGARGIERMLYGLGEVASYAWFAKYAALVSVGGTTLMFALTREVIWAPISLLVTQFAYYEIVILLAARRRVNLPLRQTATRSLPRPLVATGILTLVLFLARPAFTPLTLPLLLGLLALVGAAYGPLLYFLVLERDERSRILELCRAFAQVLRRTINRLGFTP